MKNSNKDGVPEAPRRKRRRVPGVRLGAGTHGRGVFATRRFRQGDLIGRVTGRVIDDPDYSTDYCMDLGGSLSLEPGPPFRYLNHACGPNAMITHFEDEEHRAATELWIEAIASIEPGDEITIDYGWPADDAIRCRCGGPQCRGWIVATEELPLLPAEQSSKETRPPAAT